MITHVIFLGANRAFKLMYACKSIKPSACLVTDWSLFWLVTPVFFFGESKGCFTCKKTTRSNSV
jgi:hypothetical protein